MKTKISLRVAAFVCGLFLTVQSGFAQGSLTPPGAPAPTMKTLAQVEPRTMISSLPFVITTPGSYYLTTNLAGASGQNGITISNGNVTLDLDGFTLQGAGFAIGINIPGAQTNITVRNGVISGWGNSGVLSQSASSMNIVAEGLNISSNGFGINIGAGACVVRGCNCQNNVNYGISCASGSIISGCTAGNNGASGIFCNGSSIISDCTTDNNGGNGIFCNGREVTGCTADNNSSVGIICEGGDVTGCTADNNGEPGIDVIGGTVAGCYAQNNGTYGIYVAPGTVTGCQARNNSASGIYVDAPGSTVIGNTSLGNNTVNSLSDAGILIDDSNNRVENNHVTASVNAGIRVISSYTNNLIIKNSVMGNGANNYIFNSSQIVGPLITNSVSGVITNTNPWANFSF